MRNTKASILITEVLQRGDRPISLTELHTKIQCILPNVAFSTVARVVQRLEEAELVIRIDWRERGSHYEWAADPHHHIVCRICSDVRDLSDTELGFDSNHVESITGYLIKRHSIELEGICKTCQKSMCKN